MTRKWNIIDHQSNASYDAGNEIIHNTEVLKSNLCNYNNACILVRGDITVLQDNGNQVAFKYCGSFVTCITRIDGTTIDDAQDSVLVMPMYNFLCSLQFYFKDEANIFSNGIRNNLSFKSFKYKAKLLGSTDAQPTPNNQNGIPKNATNAMLLKYLNNFWRSLEIPLINYKVELSTKWIKQCVFSILGNKNADPNSNNIIFTSKMQNYMFLLSLYQQKLINNYQKFLAEDLKVSVWE